MLMKSLFLVFSVLFFLSVFCGCVLFPSPKVKYISESVDVGNQTIIIHFTNNNEKNQLLSLLNIEQDAPVAQMDRATDF